MMTPYDAWKLSGPDETPEIGTEEGDPCNRYPEPDEDQPRGYKPKRCRGMMENVDWIFVCATCGEVA